MQATANPVTTFVKLLTPQVRSSSPIGLSSLLRAWFAACTLMLLAACGGSGPNDTVATTAPTLEISSNISGIASGPVTIHFQFSAGVAPFPSGSLPFTLRGGRQVPGSFTSLSAREFTVIITPNANTSGAIELSVPPGAFSDATGRVSNTSAYNFAQAFDTAISPTVPWVDISSNLQGSANGPITLTFSFNMDVGSSFTLDKLILGDLTAGNLIKLSPTVYTLVVTPPANSRGTAIVTLPEGAVTDALSGLPNTRDFGYVFFYQMP